MRYVDEFRAVDSVQRLAEEIRKTTIQHWSVMEVCGGQTHAIMRYGLQELLPEEITLLHGPGCPVCVTPQSYIDKAIEIALLPDVVFCTFGDMLRVPSGDSDLAQAKARGGDVRVVYSPVDAVEVARVNPDKDVVFFAVGFETTAPANALAVRRAKDEGLTNFSLLVSQVLVPPALLALLSQPDCRIDAFLAAGHVCAVAGLDAYHAIAEKHHTPIVATGFEPADILRGVLHAVRQLEAGEAFVENSYERAVAQQGNKTAQALMMEIFEIAPKEWRGMGVIPASGLALNAAHADFDAERRFGAIGAAPRRDCGCISGAILQGVKRPPDCPRFATSCTPDNPIGVTMASMEGACSAYYQYREGGSGHER
ncbi:hydrogenase formation protein HypD [Hyphococcus luteus]|uniref:Hydrogenase maturation factor n=1 Tax=Hyphococcus luteus TaxID=2058213 RepID=A0A2S7K0C7_9PROT|nr:hydrogenase formation protein HypD [Marinicaulis flavus]PQA85975.1 hydrogenase formation protein HypD [Marinicaulis flavus]